jgi:uncharacterized protein YuzE
MVPITYDPAAKAAYIWLQSGATSVRTVELDASVMVDYDEAGRLIGVELIGVERPYLTSDAPGIPAGISRRPVLRRPPRLPETD